MIRWLWQDMGTGLGATGVSNNSMCTNSIIFRKSFASADRPGSCSLSLSRGRQTRAGTGWTTTSPWRRTMRTSSSIGCRRTSTLSGRRGLTPLTGSVQQQCMHGGFTAKQTTFPMKPGLTNHLANAAPAWYFLWPANLGLRDLEMLWDQPNPNKPTMLQVNIPPKFPKKLGLSCAKFRTS